MTFNEAFAKRVRELIDKNGTTQYKIEQGAGLYHSTMNAIMNGAYKASNSRTLTLIIRELGVSISEFYNSELFDFNNLDID